MKMSPSVTKPTVQLDVVCRSSPLPGGRSERATDLGGEMKLSEANQCLQGRSHGL